MTDTTTLERLLLDDLDVEGERAADESFCTELYRALTRNVWRNDRDPDGQLSPSFGRAEWLVNEWRARRGAEPLTLAQTGDEGAVSGDGRGPARPARLEPQRAADGPRPPGPPRPRRVAAAAGPRRAHGARAVVRGAGARGPRGGRRRAREEGRMTADEGDTSAVHTGA